MRALMVALVAVVLSGCAAFKSDVKPIAKTVDELAQEACALYFGDKQGISVEDAFRVYCTARKDFAPFIDPILAAEQAGGSVALKAREAK